MLELVDREMAQRSDAHGYLDEAGYDAVVVGSGYGGSVAACRLAMAGIKACLIEKGRSWEAKDFPTNDLQIMSQIRMESTTYGFSYGPKNGLFQVNSSCPMVDSSSFLIWFLFLFVHLCIYPMYIY